MARSAAAARQAPARSAKPRPAARRTTAKRPAGAHAGTKRSAKAHAGTKRSAKARAATKRPATRRAAGHAAPRRSPHSANGRARTASRPRAGGGAVALPLPVRVLNAPAARAIRARGRVLLDKLLQGQGWIGLIGVLLAGIVFFNVYLLQLNRDIAATSEKAAAVKRENARLRLDVARLGSSERIQLAAAAQGLVLPAPGEVRYLRANPSVDGKRAARRVESPGEVVAPAPMAPEPMAPDPMAAEPTAPAAADPTTTAPPAAEAPVEPVAEEQAAAAPAPIATSP